MKRIFILLCMLCISACSLHTPEAVPEITDYKYGVINFYAESTLERTEPIITASVALTEEEAARVKQYIDNVDKWINDALVDRLPFYFDGEIKLADSDAVYYFAYDTKIFRRDSESHFGTLEKEAVKYIKSLRTKKETA